MPEHAGRGRKKKQQAELFDDAKGAEVEVLPGGLRIARHGQIRKLVGKVAAVTFSGDQARLRSQEVVYVTERAVFELTPDGIARNQQNEITETMLH